MTDTQIAAAVIAAGFFAFVVIFNYAAANCSTPRQTREIERELRRLEARDLVLHSIRGAHASSVVPIRRVP